ncbi:AcrB/AcrD/AcrF family protein [Sphingosinicella rhizophila]|uniref:AcrB/AcrD/AcrF family protein n=1 Tax=Sphingosinicella rhizophila TaxID=3050082 RepID=A0ABU3Q7V7_9SPHN|nr:AcrB/AcrD/AcrF family protein [Sphingosinicella sp. GR2756]MDT9599461.1 AcrB/AcrD/AcrF family protein [Sphingosinicella sp. GR2756]
MAETDPLDRYWRVMLLVTWLGAAAVFVYMRWDAIRWFVLGDTDDNMRIMQVRALMSGQSWYDLRQYRLDPPFGADMHWSRLVDLPIAAIKYVLTPFAGALNAERAAVAIAPMLPMGVAMASIAVAARRLLAPWAFVIAIAILFCAPSLRGMWVPLRIDHHGWQLALLSLAMVALTDPKRARGGALLGAASALSLVIGLEMLLYLATAGAAMVLMWIWDGTRSRALAVYGASLAGGSALGYLLFASYANRAPVCDALSPVWLSAMVSAGAVAVALPFIAARTAGTRLAAAGLGGIAIAAAFAYFWPQCLGRLEGVSPEAQALWLNNVREALPVYRHGAQTAIAIASLPVIGLVGYAIMLWRSRADQAALMRWAPLAALALLAASLLLWQTRAGAASQLLALPGATALGWMILPRLRGSTHLLVRTTGTVAAFLLISGLLTQNAARLLPKKEDDNPRLKAVNIANNRCPTLRALRPIALLPKGYVLTFVDLGPRLITVTHHDAVAGPYHRNDEDIVDVMKAFRGTPEAAQRMVARRGIDYVLICPNLSESTIYASKARNGFYMQLNRGKVPSWLERVPLPASSPYKMWRVIKR